MKLTLSICFLIFVFFSVNGQTGQGCLPGCSCGPQGNNKGTQYRILTCNALPEQPIPSQFTTLQAKRSPTNLTRTDLLKLNPTSITTLDLCHSGIHNIASATFSVVHQLTTLKLSFNSIHTLSPGYFLGCNKLQKIYLDENELTNIEDDCFSRLTRLKILYLHHNKLKTLPALPPNVIQLDISNNDISSLDNYAFQQNMKNLDICENPIKNIPEACFAKAQSMTSLCAPSIPIVLKSANTKTTILPSLQNFTLIAPMNGIELSDDIIQQIVAMENLEFLTIVGYKISTAVFLVEKTLRKLRLENVRLIGNKEKEFLNAIYKQEKLQELDLNSSPQLSSILIEDVTVWNTLINLHYLGLSNCSLTTLGHLQNDKGMILVDLSLNPLHCDCTLATKFNNGVMIVGDLSSTICNSPIKYKNQVLSKVLPQLCDEEEGESPSDPRDPSNNPNTQFDSSEETEADFERVGKIDKETTPNNPDSTKLEKVVQPGKSTNVRDVIPVNSRENLDIDAGAPTNSNDYPEEDSPNNPNGTPEDNGEPNIDNGSNNNDGFATGESESDTNIDQNNPNGNGENPPDGQNNPNGNEDHTSANENPDHEPEKEEETTAHTTEEVTEINKENYHHVTDSQGFQGYLDEDEHNSQHNTDEHKQNNEQTYIIVGIVIALTLIAAVIFSTLFFYFRRRGHAGIEGGNAQYRSQANSRDNLVNKTRGYD